LAQLNVARLLEPIDAPASAEFVAALDPINARADAAPGFVWRLQDDSGNATHILTTPDPLFIVNLSVWESLDALREFVYDSDHTPFLRRRREWFEKPSEAFLVLWWVPAGHVPTTDEALDRLATLRANGPTPDAFTFRETFSPTGPPGSG
jgi:hypothetical protein